MTSNQERSQEKTARNAPPVDIVAIRDQHTIWRSDYEENDSRGKSDVLFAQANNQWTASVVGNRQSDNKEVLTFNLVLKHLQRVQAQASEIEFTLDMAATNDLYAANVEETNAFRLMLADIMLCNDSLRIYKEGFNKCTEYGYSVAQIDFEREDEYSLCCIPVTRILKDPTIAFFDKRASHPSKIDGRFCGLKRLIDREEVLEAYPKYKNEDYSWIKDKNNDLYDYWYRHYTPAKFICLETGVYKREDLLTEEDQKIIKIDPKTNQPYSKKGKVCRIFFLRYLNEHLLLKPELFPTDDLPLVYHWAGTVWTPEKDLTFSFVHPMKGAQMLHNYIQSQNATVVKNYSGDKWFFTMEMVEAEDKQLEAREINSREGGFYFPGDPAQIRREQPAQLPPTMIEYAQVTKQEIDEIAGAMTDKQDAQRTVLSGIALDRITRNTELLQAPRLAAHIEWVNTIGKLYRQMIPRIYTQERTLVVKKQDGSGQAIKINEYLPTGRIKNNIKDINSNFHYEIKAGPSSTMINFQMLQELREMYAINPGLFNSTADIYMRCLDNPYSGELQRRVTPIVDENLIKYSQGQMSETEFRAYLKEQNDKAMQAQQNNPEAMSMTQIAQAESIKAQAAIFRAQTERMKQVSEAMNQQRQLQLQLLEIIQKGEGEEAKRQIEIVKIELERNAKVIDTLMTLEQKNAESPAVY